MKKLFLAAFAALLSISLSAQIYVGGSFNFTSVSNDDNIADTHAKINALTFAPHAGYWLTEKFAVGGYLNIAAGTPAYKVNRFGFGITPYARYILLSAYNINLLAEAGINFYTQNDKDTSMPGGYVRDTDTTVGIYVEPVITYALNEKINLEAGLNLARLAFSSVSSKSVTHIDNPAGDTTTLDDKTTSFTLGATTNDIFGGGIGAVRIGFTYNF